MKPVKQEETLGCGVACVAFICNLTYREARLKLFRNLAIERNGVFCQDIVSALGKCEKKYSWKKAKQGEKIPFNSIVFVKSKKYSVGHYLVKMRGRRGSKGRAGGLFMDPWLNLNERFDLNVKAGYRKTLPAPAKYVIYPL